jgi:heterodisulfide reductase subunit A
MHKRALVIGGGVAGIQAALDLGEMGIETYLVERAPSIGGRMAQLDKTFPTNDCAMCILSPKLVEASSHPYVTVMSHTRVMELSGEAPRFKVRLLKMPRYVNEELCNGCGACVAKCPTRIPDPYNKNLSLTKCIHIPFPQAVPAVAVIDRDSCRYFASRSESRGEREARSFERASSETGKCRVCEKACQLKAIDFEQKEQVVELEVGSVILASGTREFDARRKNEYGYKLFPNVVTSIEFERLLSASGPTGGHVVRPSDKKEPQRIAILQCVGSRDAQAGNEHCSAVCCMQAAKDAIIVNEHAHDARTTVFYMDLRAYGKDFDKFVERAQERHGTRFIRARVSSIENAADGSDNLVVEYAPTGGAVTREEFDLVVLSVGLEPSESAVQTASKLGIAVDGRGFAVTGAFSPVSSGRHGVFVCGSVSGPKDIPESVMEASGAASAAASVLAGLERKKVAVSYPAEKDSVSRSPRVGVFVCRCGINIAGTVDVPAVVERARSLPGVRHAQELLFACAEDSQKAIKEAIRGNDLTHIVVSACTPRTHEPLFQKTLREAGLNPFVFEFANIREQCAWVHQGEKEKATAKACDLVRSAVAKVRFAEPLYKKSLSVNRDALVIGGGLAGMTAGLDLASQGYTVHLAEKEAELGGNLRRVKTALDGEAPAEMLDELIGKVKAHPGIKTYLNARLREVSGFVGNFTTTLEPSGEEIKHGVVIIASGGEEHKPAEYLYGEDDAVMTQTEFEGLLGARDDGRLKAARSVVMIQCAGSRESDRPYCSRICCTQAIKNAIALKERYPKASISILYRDIRTYGLREGHYKKARSMGVSFFQYDKDAKPLVSPNGSGLEVALTDAILNRPLLLKADLLVLSTGVAPNQSNKELSRFLKVPLNQDGFFLEAHVKLRPVDFATDGVFVCGLAHYPKDIRETIAQARAAAGRAATILGKETLEAECRVASVREDRCSGCRACVAVCAYGAPSFDEKKGVVVINEALCKGCGVCAATCRSSAVDLKGFKNEQILAALETL